MNIMFKPHTEDTFSKNTRKEAIINDVQLTQENCCRKSWSTPKPDHTINLVSYGKGHQLVHDIVWYKIFSVQHTATMMFPGGFFLRVLRVGFFNGPTDNLNINKRGKGSDR